jgi:hypothetical protein
MARDLKFGRLLPACAVAPAAGGTGLANAFVAGLTGSRVISDASESPTSLVVPSALQYQLTLMRSMSRWLLPERVHAGHGTQRNRGFAACMEPRRGWTTNRNSKPDSIALTGRHVPTV